MTSFLLYHSVCGHLSLLIDVPRENALKSPVSKVGLIAQKMQFLLQSYAKMLLKLVSKCTEIHTDCLKMCKKMKSCL